jgi:hypothetical protein
VDAFLAQFCGSTDIVLPERVATIDDGVPAAEQIAELRHMILGDLA